MNNLPYNALLIIGNKVLSKPFPTIKEAADSLVTLEEGTPKTKAVYIITQLTEEELSILFGADPS